MRWSGYPGTAIDDHPHCQPVSYRASDSASHRASHTYAFAESVAYTLAESVGDTSPGY